MNYDKFKLKVSSMPLFTTQYLRLNNMLNHNNKIQLYRWQKNNKIVSLKRGVYMLNKDDRKIHPSKMFVSQQLYNPSYVSMEYALSFYGLIPEKTVDITCISSKKTAQFENEFGRFIYQHIDRKFFSGFIVEQDETGLKYFIATPEKAVADFIYLNQSKFTGEYKKILFESFRFQNIDILDKSKLNLFTNQFYGNKVKKIMEALYD